MWILKERQFLLNLEKLQKDDLDIQGKSISLKLPAVEGINFSYPAELFEMDTLVSTDAFLNKISLEDQENFFQDAEIDIRNSLKHMNIIEATERKTRLMLENLLRTLGYKEIYIDFHKGELIPEITEEEVGIWFIS